MRREQVTAKITALNKNLDSVPGLYHYGFWLSTARTGYDLYYENKLIITSSLKQIYAILDGCDLLINNLMHRLSQ